MKDLQQIIKELKKMGEVSVDYINIEKPWKNPQTGQWEPFRVKYIIKINNVTAGSGWTVGEAIECAFSRYKSKHQNQTTKK